MRSSNIAAAQGIYALYRKMQVWTGAVTSAVHCPNRLASLHWVALVYQYAPVLHVRVEGINGPIEQIVSDKQGVTKPPRTAGLRRGPNHCDCAGADRADLAAGRTRKVYAGVVLLVHETLRNYVPIPVGSRRRHRGLRGVPHRVDELRH